MRSATDPTRIASPTALQRRLQSDRDLAWEEVQVPPPGAEVVIIEVYNDLWRTAATEGGAHA